ILIARGRIGDGQDRLEACPIQQFVERQCDGVEIGSQPKSQPAFSCTENPHPMTRMREAIQSAVGLFSEAEFGNVLRWKKHRHESVFTTRLATQPASDPRV